MAPRVGFIAVVLVLGVASSHALADTTPERTQLRALESAGEWARAESLASACLAREQRSATADSLWLADLCLSVAQARNARHQLGDDVAETRARRALGIRRRHLAASDPAIADAEALLAELITESHTDEAFEHAQRALEARRALKPPVDSLVAESWYDLGAIEALRGNGRAALAALAPALAIRERLYGPAHRKLVPVLYTMGDAYRALGLLDSCRVANQHALDVLDRCAPPNDLLRAEPLGRLVEVYVNTGELSKALDLAREAVRVTDGSGDTYQIVSARSNLGVIMQEFEDHAAAIEAFEPLVPMCEGLPVNQQWLRDLVLQALANSYLATSRFPEALKLYRKGEAGAKAHPNPAGLAGLALCLTGESEVLNAWKRYSEALALNLRGTAMNDSAAYPDRISCVTNRAQRLRILEALHDRAGLARVRDEIGVVRDSYRLQGTSLAATAAYWVARADHGIGRDSLAWSEGLEADRIVREMMLLNFANLPDVRALELSRRKSYMLSQVLELAGPHDAEHWVDAWDRLAQTRGLVRAELARRRVPTEWAGDSTLVRRHDAWFAAQRALARRLVQGVAANEDSASHAELDRLRTRVELAESAYARALHAHGADTVRVHVGLDDVRRRLRSDQVLVAFAEIECWDQHIRVIAFVARGGEPRVTRLSFGTVDSLRDMIRPWRKRLGAPPGTAASASGAAERECRRYGERVRARLWGRLEPFVGNAAEIVIVPDGPIADVAWNALPIGATGYRVESGPLIRVIDSERDLVGEPRAQEDRVLLAVGSPAYEEARPTGEAQATRAMMTMRAVIDPCIVTTARRFPPLPGTGAEAEGVARAWRSGVGRTATVLLGAEATEAAFKARAAGSDVIHLATHGFVAGNDCGEAASGSRGVGGVAAIGSTGSATPARSHAKAAPLPASPWMDRRVWLALASADHAADAGRDEDDGLLTAEEVGTLDLSRADWVVLSACHSGLSESWWHEGTLGMERAFKLAGARSVIASQWAVEDASTADLMRALYAARSAGDSSAASALRTACRQILEQRRRSGRSAHPFYWAAFRASGE